MVQAICVILKNVITLIFACICARSISARGSLHGFGKIKTVLHNNLTFFSILHQIQSFPSPQPPKISYLKAFCSDLCWHVLWEAMVLVWSFTQPSFPIQWQEAISSNKHYCSSSCTTTLILHSQFLWKVSIFFSYTLCVFIEWFCLRGFFFFSDFLDTLNKSVKESTFYHTLLGMVNYPLSID